MSTVPDLASGKSRPAVLQGHFATIARPLLGREAVPDKPGEPAVIPAFLAPVARETALATSCPCDSAERSCRRFDAAVAGHNRPIDILRRRRSGVSPIFRPPEAGCRGYSRRRPPVRYES